MFRTSQVQRYLTEEEEAELAKTQEASEQASRAVQGVVQFLQQLQLRRQADGWISEKQGGDSPTATFRT